MNIDRGIPLCGSDPRGMDPISAMRKDGKPRKRNGYPGNCFLCGRYLAPNEGVIERSADGTWTVACSRPPR